MDSKSLAAITFKMGEWRGMGRKREAGWGMEKRGRVERVSIRAHLIGTHSPTHLPTPQHTHTYLSYVAKLEVRICCTRYDWCRRWSSGGRRGRGRKVTGHYPAPRTTALDCLQRSKVEFSTDTPIITISCYDSIYMYPQCTIACTIIYPPNQNTQHNKRCS